MRSSSPTTHRAGNEMMSLEHWLAYGLEQGFCSKAVCDTHEGLPYTKVEYEAFEDGEDPCVVGVRVYCD